MIENLQTFLANVGTSRLVMAVIAVASVLLSAQLLRKAIGSQISDVDVRYRTRKFVTLFNYLLAVLVFLSVFSDRLSRLSVAFV